MIPLMELMVSFIMCPLPFKIPGLSNYINPACDSRSPSKTAVLNLTKHHWDDSCLTLCSKDNYKAVLGWLIFHSICNFSANKLVELEMHLVTYIWGKTPYTDEMNEENAAAAHNWSWPTGAGQLIPPAFIPGADCWVESVAT